MKAWLIKSIQSHSISLFLWGLDTKMVKEFIKIMHGSNDLADSTMFELLKYVDDFVKKRDKEILKRTKRGSRLSRKQIEEASIDSVRSGRKSVVGGLFRKSPQQEAPSASATPTNDFSGISSMSLKEAEISSSQEAPVKLNVDSSKIKKELADDAEPVKDKAKGGVKEKATKAKAAKEKASKEKAAKDKALKEKAAKEKAAKEKAAKEKEAKQKTAKEKAAREKAAKEKSAKEKAAKEKAVREKAAQEKAAKQKAAERKAANEKAANRRAEKENARNASPEEDIDAELALLQKKKEERARYKVCKSILLINSANHNKLPVSPFVGPAESRTGARRS